MPSIASVIIPTCNFIPARIINDMINQHRRQSLNVDIIVSNMGYRTDSLECDCLVQYPEENLYNLSRSRNKGSRRSNSKWLIFTDCDIYYDDDLFQKIVRIAENHNKLAVRGNTLYNRKLPGSKVIGDKYHCGAAPMFINRSLYEIIGGYCEDYVGWGYEDSDLEHKLKDLGYFVNDFDAGGYHVLDYHNVIRQNASMWNNNDSNRPLFEKRCNTNVYQRVMADRAAYF